MDYVVVEARYVGAHTVWLRFRDRVSGEADLAAELRGEVFERLRDVDVVGQEKQAGSRMHRLPAFRFPQWARRDSNPGPLLCESSALTS